MSYNSGASAFKLLIGTGKTLVTTGTSQPFTAVGQETFAVRIVVKTQDVRIEIGRPGIVATATSALMTTLQGTEYFAVAPGDVVAVFQDTATGGVVSLTECTH